MLYFYYYLLCFRFNKIGEQEGGPGSAWKQGGWGGGAGGPNDAYTCKEMQNSKIKSKK
jgi:hypothetical protein